MSRVPDSEFDLSQERPTVQRAHKTIHLRASSLGKCVRALAAEAMQFEGAPPSESLKASAKAGHRHEQWMKEDIEEKYGMRLSIQQGRCEQTYEVEGWTFVISGRYEGIWTLNDNPAFLWENKSMSGNQFKLWKSSVDKDNNPTFKNHDSYAWQLSHYQTCVGLPVLYTVRNRDSGVALEHTINEPPYSVEDVEDRLATIVALLEAGPQALFDNANCDPNAVRFLCPYKDSLSCLTKVSGLTDGVEEVFDQELEEALIMHEAAKLDAAAANKRKKEARKVIDKYMQQDGEIVTMMGYGAKRTPKKITDNDALEAFLAEHGKTKKHFEKDSFIITTSKPKGV